MVASCGVELFAGWIEAGEPGSFVRLKWAWVVTPATEAITTYEPAIPFAVKVTEAMPIEFVVVPPVKVPLGPVDAGAVKVTTTPLVGDPLVVTVTWSWVAN
jgi:hypothetical protein